MKFGSDFTADYNDGSLSLLKEAFDSSVPNGALILKVEFYHGQIVNYALQKSGNMVTGSGIVF